ncbi:hypothetical protein ZWY2020_032906 [Hordeum vulgare]|nr:hypothetical protein ZWY2020_032906 [Hordeum vulgare]
MFIHERVVRRVGRPLICHGPMFIRDQERIQNLNYIYNCNDVEALWMLRMKRAPFAKLVKTFRIRGRLQDNINTSVEEQVAMFLHVVGHNQRFRIIHNTSRRSMETISRYFKQVLFVVGELRGEMTRRPSVPPPKIRGSPRWYPYFKESIDNCYCNKRPSNGARNRSVDGRSCLDTPQQRHQKSFCYGYALRDFLAKYAKDFPRGLGALRWCSLEAETVM